MADATDFGLHPANSPTANLLALRRAVAATQAGGILRIGKQPGGAITVDTSGGLSAAVQIDRPMTIQLDGALKASTGERRANPAYLFHVAAQNVTFEEFGELAGPGSVDDWNVQEETKFPGLVFVTGDQFRWIGPTIRRPPKVGIFLWQCHEATISGKWRGGVTSYREGRTSYFGIRATGGGWHHIIGNDFGADENGGRLISAFFNGGVHGGATACTIHGNHADVHEKLAYLWGDHHDVANCTIVNALQTDIVRLNGSHNRVSRISGTRVKGGVSIYDGVDNEVSDCTFTAVTQTGVYVAGTQKYAGGFDGTRILRNKIVANPASSGLQDGILLNLSGSDTRQIRIEENEITGFGSLPNQALIRVQMAAPYHLRELSISGNHLTGGRQAGIRLSRVIEPGIEGNIDRRLAGPPLIQSP